MTGGNPFFAREVLALLHGRRQGTGAVGGTAGSTGGHHAALGRLSNACDEMLKVAAVIGATFTTEDLAAATDLTSPRCSDCWTKPCGPGLAIDDRFRVGCGSRMTFCGRRFTAPWPRRRGLPPTRQVAAALEARRATAAASPATIAHHLIGAIPLVERARALAAAMPCRRRGDGGARERGSQRVVRARPVARAHRRRVETRCDRPLLSLGEARLRGSDLPRARDAYVEAANIARRHGRPDDLAQAALGLGAGLGGFEISLFDHVQIELLEQALRRSRSRPTQHGAPSSWPDSRSRFVRGGGPPARVEHAKRWPWLDVWTTGRPWATPWRRSVTPSRDRPSPKPGATQPSRGGGPRTGAR